MSNEWTKKQIREFIENAVEKARNPDPKEKIRRKRELRAKKISKKYGL